MRNIFVVLLLLLSVSCMEFEDANNNLCVSVFCGETLPDQVNFTIYNDTGIDFDEFVWDVGGVSDTVNLFSLKQYTCWYNYDSLNTSYFYAIGKSENSVYEMDTVKVPEEAIRNLQSGKYALEIYRIDQSDKLFSLLIDDYSGECRDF